MCFFATLPQMLLSHTCDKAMVRRHGILQLNSNVYWLIWHHWAETANSSGNSIWIWNYPMYLLEVFILVQFGHDKRRYQYWPISDTPYICWALMPTISWCLVQILCPGCAALLLLRHLSYSYEKGLWKWCIHIRTSILRLYTCKRESLYRRIIIVWNNKPDIFWDGHHTMTILNHLQPFWL